MCKTRRPDSIWEESIFSVCHLCCSQGKIQRPAPQGWIQNLTRAIVTVERDTCHQCAKVCSQGLRLFCRAQRVRGSPGSLETRRCCPRASGWYSCLGEVYLHADADNRVRTNKQTSRPYPRTVDNLISMCILTERPEGQVCPVCVVREGQARSVCIVREVLREARTQACHITRHRSAM